MATNERLRSALATKGLSIEAVAQALLVDPKTVHRWLLGRVPHPRHRMALVRLLSAEEGYLWPSARPDLSPGTEATHEVIAAYGHRVDVPREKWNDLLTSSRRHIDLLGYAFLFLPEQHVELIPIIKQKCANGCRVRILVADPEGCQVQERDRLEDLGGTLQGRIRTTLHHIEPLRQIRGVEIRLHDVHLYNAIYRFDDDMIVTPYLYRAHGYEHPALHLHRLSAYGVFAAFADQYDLIWSVASTSHQQSILTERTVTVGTS